MALPKLNQTPTYELNIPSTGEKLQYRPFLVKEQKILLMALETQDEKNILRTIRNTFSQCVLTECNVNKLKIFDIEYIFLQMRSKSVGENISLTFKCGECESENSVKIPLSTIRPEILPDIIKDVNIADTYNLKLDYPSFGAIIESIVPEDESGAETIFRVAKLTLHSIQSDDENTLFADESYEEIDDFFGSLTTDQFNQIIEFTEGLPTVKYDINFDCKKCNANNIHNLQGIQDFF